MMLQGSR